MKNLIFACILILGLTIAAYGASSPLANCTAHPIYTSDGSVCRTIEVENTSQDPASSQDVTVRYQNGNTDTVTLTKGQKTTFDTKIRSIIVHEDGAPIGEVTWTIT